MNSDMVQPEKFGYLHLAYHFTAPLRKNKKQKLEMCLKIATVRKLLFKYLGKIWPLNLKFSRKLREY